MKLVSEVLAEGHSTNGGTTFLQSVDMRYNIRGWLKTINDETLTSESSDLFGMKLHYETTVSGLNGSSAEAQFNGNIAAQEWNVKTRGRRGYGYTYDKLNQLLNAKYAAYNDEIFNYVLDVSRFTESMSYDLNGNILSLSRNGKNSWSGQGTYGTMDQLSYTYTGNRVIGVDDAVDDIANNNRYDFSDNSHQGSVQEGNPGTWEYQYDGNGNMIQDQNKGIDSIKYNFLNLPTKICFPGGDSIVYVYTVSGAKLRKTVYDNGIVQTTIDYVSGYQYKNGSLDFFAMEAGRVKKTTSGSLRYEYNLTDHLGNTRVSFSDTLGNGTAVILQEDHYYAFGLRIEGLSSTTKDNKFTYNGKELEDDHGLGWYHYGARNYDPQVGRWWAVDPLNEFYSPYEYVGNDPLGLLDPDGRGSDDWLTAIGNAIGDFFSGWTEQTQEKNEQRSAAALGDKSAKQALNVKTMVNSEIMAIPQKTHQAAVVTASALQDVSDAAAVVEVASYALAPLTDGTSLSVAGPARTIGYSADILATSILAYDAAYFGGSGSDAFSQGADVMLGYTYDKRITVVKPTNFAVGAKYRAGVTVSSVGLRAGRFVTNNSGYTIEALKSTVWWRISSAVFK